MKQPYLALITPLSGAHPDHELPGGPPIFHPGHPDHGLPSGGAHPWLPGHLGGGNRPDNSLPGGRPPSWGGGWGGGAVDPGWGVGRPPRPGHDLPWAPVRPDHGLPGDQPGIDNSLPWGPPGGSIDNTLPGAQPKVHQAAVPPTPPESVNTEEGIWVIVNVNGALAWAWAQKPVPPAGTKPIEPPEAQPK